MFMLKPSAPFVFEPFRAIYEKYEKLIIEKFGEAIRPLWCEFLNHHILNFIKKNKSILNNWENWSPEAYQKMDKAKKMLSEDIHSIQDAELKAEGRKLYSILFRRFTSPKKRKKAQEDYEQEVKYVVEALISRDDCLRILSQGLKEKKIGWQDIAELEKIKSRLDSPSTPNRLAILFGKFPDRKRNILTNAFAMEMICARKTDRPAAYQEIIWEILKTLVRSRTKDGRICKKDEKVLLHLCDRFERRERGGIEPLYNRTMALERKHRQWLFATQQERQGLRQKCG